MARRWRPWRVLGGSALALLAIGALLLATRPGAGPAGPTLLLAGVALLAAVAVVNRGTLLAFARGRAARRGADSLLATFFFVAILVVVQATSVRHSRLYDLTRNHRHTLAPQTLSLLDSLGADVKATAFFRENSAAREGAQELLELYARRAPRFTYRMVDPDRHPDLAERLGVREDEIVVEAGATRRSARSPNEEALTNAILQATRAGTKAVYFVTGHGEKDIDGDQRDGYAAARKGLESQGYAVRALSLVGTRSVPADAAVVVVAGPRSDYLDDEVNLLRSYLDGGGSVLFLIDPRVAVPHLAGLLADYRLALVDAVIIDQRVVDSGDRTFDATVAKVHRYEKHAITRGFNYVTMYPRARPVRITVDSTDVGYDAQYLCITDDQAWGEVDMNGFAAGTAVRQGNDIAGPMPLAAAVQYNPRGRPMRRVVLVGDSDFANNVFYGVLGNSDFFQNLVAYLTEEEGMITIRPRPPLGDRVYITQSQGRLVFAVSLVVLPLSSIVAGIVVFVRRRRL